ncbi:SH3 domain-containing protein [Clostridium chromiireducens]|uniref:SH3 domain-containing protein n=1 Tax=Clostridium chromiireducens TaxID=225345 RepID=A0A964RRP4_9CLOT|nr:SH3 domain-containing protein [Clostridium chromiireducens]MVX66634.1 SH3 domain-containing protein [Clostridium chromiireducens]
MIRNKTRLSVLSSLIVAGSILFGGVNVSAATLDQSNKVNNKAYVNNPEVQIDLKLRLTPDINGEVEGNLYNYENVQILDTVTTNGTVWDKIMYNNNSLYVSDAYIKHYTAPTDDVVNIARNISKQFEVGNLDQIAGNFDGQGLSLGYFQWCIGQGTLQPILNRMDREYNDEMKSIFGTNYNSIHNMIIDTTENQLAWARTINDSTNKITQPWYSQFVSLCNNQHFINIELDAEAYKVSQAMIICDKYNLKSVRGFALAFDIAVQNGSISSEAAKIIDTALAQKPDMNEKDLLKVIANAVADTSINNPEDIRSRKISIVNGTGKVHGLMLDLDRNYGLSDSYWR